MLRTVGIEEIMGLTQKLNPIRIVLTRMGVTFKVLDQKVEGNCWHELRRMRFFFRISGVYKVSDLFYFCLVRFLDLPTRDGYGRG